MLDLTSAEVVDLYVDETGKVWVNVDGKCVVRVGYAVAVNIDDPVRGQDCLEFSRMKEKA